MDALRKEENNIAMGMEFPDNCLPG